MQKSTLSRLLPTLAIAVVLSACSPVTYNRDEAVSIPPQATVAFAGGKWEDDENLDPRVDNDSVHQRIQGSITSQLQSRGFTVSRDEATADFLLHYFMAFRREPTPVTSSGSLARATPAPRPGWGWGWRGDAVTTITPQDFVNDSLIVELVERSSGQLAWRAVWRGEADMKAPTREEIDAKMKKVFRSAPSAD